MGYEIVKFLPEVQNYIKTNSIDKNADGKINKDNGELQELLSGHKCTEVDDLLAEDPKKEDYKSAMAITGLFTAMSSAVLLQGKFIKPPLKKWMENTCKFNNCSPAEAKRLLRNSGMIPSKYESLGVAAIGMAVGLALAAYYVFREPKKN